VVATARALKFHGGVARADLNHENVAALEAGLSNLGKHLENVKQYGVQPVVAINGFTADTEAEHDAIKAFCDGLGVQAAICTHWAEGGKGTIELAEIVAATADSGVSKFAPIYPDAMPLADKARTVAQMIYGADDIDVSGPAARQLKQFEEKGYGHLPVCMAKTQYSFSTDPSAKGAPTGHTVEIREARLSAGAEFVVLICGDIMTMPGLPRTPAAEAIGLNAAGDVEGLF
jgi:formate--tetrahydrofolate ligase